MKKTNHTRIHIDGPVLDKAIITQADTIDITQYPFCLKFMKDLKTITFPTQVTFLIGENGSGKSTLLEALASKAGFGPEGGSKHIQFRTTHDDLYQSINKLADCITLSWRQKPLNGYFFRAESFFNLANHIDHLAQEDARAYEAYGGKSLHKQSHGESFLSFFMNRLGSHGFFILDEPEAALSPQRQLTLLNIIYNVCKHPLSQFIIATHSPILLAYPGATIYSCDTALQKTTYTETPQYQITKEFLNRPEHYLHHLLDNN